MNVNQLRIATIISRARRKGLTGFGGDCGPAAVAINRVLFDSQGRLIAGLNRFWYEHERILGHVAVEVGNTYWDVDARPKGIDDIESWGMLDEHDVDHIEAAHRLGLNWNEEAAMEVVLVEMDDMDAIRIASDGARKCEYFEKLLREAVSKSWVK